MTDDPKSVRRWLTALAEHYPSLIVSGVCHTALAEIARLEAKNEAMRAVAEAAVLYCTTGQDRGGEKLLKAVAAYMEMKK
jgi:hypothetical protein